MCAGSSSGHQEKQLISSSSQGRAPAGGKLPGTHGHAELGERRGLLPFPTWKPKIKSEFWEKDAVDGLSSGTELQNHREN